MQKKLLLDTDVLIDYLRDKPEAVSYIENLKEELLLSVITIAELHAGIRDETEHSAIESFLKAFQSVSLTNEIAILGGSIRRQYGKTHGTGLADALIAATAINKQATLITLNIKHFSMLDNVLLPYKKGVSPVK